jgi:hypothetical protein
MERREHNTVDVNPVLFNFDKNGKLIEKSPNLKKSNPCFF